MQRMKLGGGRWSNSWMGRFDSDRDKDGYGSSVCETYVANVWPVASIRSQNAVQHIVIRSALTMSRDAVWKKHSNSPCNSHLLGLRVSDSLTDLLEDAQVGKGSRDVQLDLLQTRLPVRRVDVWNASNKNDAGEDKQTGKGRREAIASVCRQTFRFGLGRGHRRVLPLFFSSCQTDIVQLCLGHSAEDSERVRAVSSYHDDWTKTTSEDWARHDYSAVTLTVIKGDGPPLFTCHILTQGQVTALRNSQAANRTTSVFMCNVLLRLASVFYRLYDNLHTLQAQSCFGQVVQRGHSSWILSLWLQKGFRLRNLTY